MSSPRRRCADQWARGRRGEVDSVTVKSRRPEEEDDGASLMQRAWGRTSGTRRRRRARRSSWTTWRRLEGDGGREDDEATATAALGRSRPRERERWRRGEWLGRCQGSGWVALILPRAGSGAGRRAGPTAAANWCGRGRCCAWREEGEGAGEYGPGQATVASGPSAQVRFSFLSFSFSVISFSYCYAIIWGSK